MFGQVMTRLMARDQTKWYTFSLLDIILMVFSGLIYLLGDDVQPPVVFWLCIIGCNAIISWLHNRNNDEDEE